MRTNHPYSYIWSNGRPPPLRATRWAVLLAGIAIVLFAVLEGATVELDSTLRYALSLVEKLVR